jgi:hypothetical protein
MKIGADCTGLGSLLEHAAQPVCCATHAKVHHNCNRTSAPSLAFCRVRKQPDTTVSLMFLTMAVSLQVETASMPASRICHQQPLPAAAAASASLQCCTTPCKTAVRPLSWKASATADTSSCAHALHGQFRHTPTCMRIEGQSKRKTMTELIIVGHHTCRGFCATCSHGTRDSLVMLHRRWVEHAANVNACQLAPALADRLRVCYGCRALVGLTCMQCSLSPRLPRTDWRCAPSSQLGPAGTST